MFAVNNGQVTYNGKPVDQMTEEERRRAYGTAGDINSGAQIYDFSTGSAPQGSFDPRYWEAYTIGRGDSDTATGYRLRPEYQRMQGMMQVGVPRSVGGPGEAIDPAGITYDEEFGYVTPITNIQQQPESMFNRALPLLLAGGMLGAIGATGGFAGLLGGASSSSTGALGFPVGAGPGTGPLLETAGIGSGSLAPGAGAGLNLVTGLEDIVIPPLADAPVLETLGSGFPPGAGIAGPTLETAGIATDVPWYTQALANAGVNLTNPMMVARGLMGLSSLANSLKPSSGGGSDAPGGNGDITPANVARFNPAGLLANYRAPTFDPVPFMSGKYGLLGK